MKKKENGWRGSMCLAGGGYNHRDLLGDCLCHCGF